MKLTREMISEYFTYTYNKLYVEIRDKYIDGKFNDIRDEMFCIKDYKYIEYDGSFTIEDLRSKHESFLATMPSNITDVLISVQGSKLRFSTYIITLITEDELRDKIEGVIDFRWGYYKEGDGVMNSEWVDRVKSYQIMEKIISKKSGDNFAN